MTDLDAALREIARKLAVPPAPRFAEPVLARIESRRRARSRRLRVLAVAAAVFVLFAGTVLFRVSKGGRENEH